MGMNIARRRRPASRVLTSGSITFVRVEAQRHAGQIALLGPVAVPTRSSRGAAGAGVVALPWLIWMVFADPSGGGIASGEDKGSAKIDCFGDWGDPSIPVPQA